MVAESMKRVFFELTFLACVALFGCAFYYGSVVTVGTMAATGLLAALSTLFLAKWHPITGVTGDAHDELGFSRFTIPLFAVGLLSLVAFAFSAYTNPITSAVRSLWLVFSPANILFLSVTFICTLLLYRASLRLCAVLGAMTTLVVCSLAVLLFPLGFGFDPFLHRATLEHIATYGTINPKPLYYIGAYSLELLGHLLLKIPLFSLDVFLAPVGAAVLVWIALRSKALHPATLALFPFAAFISTTPQAIGFLWVFAGVLAVRLKLPLVYAVLFGLVAFATHPLAGIPALVLVCFYVISVERRHSVASLRTRWALSITLALLGIFALPIVFFVQEILTGMDVGFSLAAFTNFSRIPALGFFSLGGKPLLDTIMLLGGNLFFITAVLAIFGYAAQQKTKEGTALLLASIVAFGNFIVLSLGFDFPFLISYERTDFALRLVTIAWIFLLPLASDGLRILAEKLSSSRSSIAYSIFLCALLFSANAYVTYPRHDGYSRSAAFNVTAADKEIVHAIAEDAGDVPYVVLSNQTLASMAVQEFGFFNYYHDTIFAYPIPTSSPLYTLFLDMIEASPTLETVQEARNLTGAETVYFVVHDYWWEADDRIAEAKNITNAWFTSQDGTISVFIFPRDSSLFPQAFR